MKHGEGYGGWGIVHDWFVPESPADTVELWHIIHHTTVSSVAGDGYGFIYVFLRDGRVMTFKNLERQKLRKEFALARSLALAGQVVKVHVELDEYGFLDDEGCPP